MSELTPKERVMRLFHREPIDTMPCFSGMGMVAIQAINEMGIRFAEVHTSAENLARSAIVTAEMFGFDAVVIPYDMCTVPEALGRGVSLYDGSEDILYPTVPTKWGGLDEVEATQGLPSFGEGAVGNQGLPVANPDGGRRSRRVERLAAEVVSGIVDGGRELHVLLHHLSLLFLSGRGLLRLFAVDQ